jgi:hypothetical protein
LSNVTALAAAANDTFALRNDGTLTGWGNNNNDQLNIPTGLSNVVAIAAGVYNGFALKADGTVVQWGNGPVWQHNGNNTNLTVAPGMSNITAVAAGGFSAWSLQSDGTVFGWGWYGFAGFSSITALSAAGTTSPTYDYVLVLRNNGTIATSGGSPFFTPYISVSPSNVVAISAGYNHAAALVNDGTPLVARQLLSQTVYSGSTAIFSSGIVGGMPLNYQWRFNGTNLAGATNALLVLTNVPLSAAGNYDSIVTNTFGAATNLNATLTVLRSTLRFNSVAAFSNNGFGWQLDQLSGHGTIIILASTNLVDWVPVFTNPPVTGSLLFLDPEATNQSCRFYRAVEQ